MALFVPGGHGGRRTNPSPLVGTSCVQIEGLDFLHQTLWMRPCSTQAPPISITATLLLHHRQCLDSMGGF
ncbi:hypothetical protein EYF80_020630 [Liparis tanakae]|uniref:Uncharacterized protein n=1 Tax=Liparis tanakae TaxID=230148 RepID=A0A4Z2HW20_9TELE|nr:hypothetical protein EYF80_020630 [Liparis tanakae]